MKPIKDRRTVGTRKPFLLIPLLLGCAALLQAQGGASTSPEQEFKTASANLKAMRWSQAKSGFKRVLKADPQNLKAHFCLGEIEYYNHRLAAAEGYFEWVNFHDPDMPVDHYYLGRVAYDQKRYGEALLEMESASRLDDRISIVHYYLGLIRYKQGDFDQAQKELEAAVALDPSSSKAHYALAFLLYHDFHDNTSAMNEANAALKADNDPSLKLKTLKLIKLIKSAKKASIASTAAGRPNFRRGDSKFGQEVKT